MVSEPKFNVFLAIFRTYPRMKVDSFTSINYNHIPCMLHISTYKVSIILAGLMLFFVYFSTVNAGTETDLLEIAFNDSLSEVELASFLEKNEGTVRELYFKHGDIQGGYTFSNNESLQHSFRELKREHLLFIEAAFSDMTSSSDKSVKKREEKLNSDLRKSKILAESEKFEVSGIVLENVIDSSQLTFDSVVKKVQVREKTIKNNEVTLAATSYYVAPKLWYPTKGTTKTDKGLAYNSFYFSDASGFDLFGGILTYEHETQVYDKAFADYAGYWSTNLPSAYKDTPFLDSIDNFTIGSSKASSIVANTKYYTSMSLKSGSASTATVRIKGQLGHRSPSGCYSTWCIYADMTTPTLKSYTAPISSVVPWTFTP